MEHRNQGKDYKDSLVIEVCMTNVIMLAYNLDLKFPAVKAKWETELCATLKRRKNVNFSGKSKDHS